MPTVDQLPTPIPTTTRDKEIERFKRSYLVRQPAADVGDNSPVDTDARAIADIVMPLYATGRINNDSALLENARGGALDAWAKREGVAPRREAFGASGSVIFAGAAGGSTLVTGDELKNEATGLRYRVIAGEHYLPNELVGVIGFDTGPTTNLPAGTQLKWTSPRPGCSDYAVVSADGLTGGRDKENDDELYLRVAQEKQNRAASGNDAEYQLEIESTPNVAIQKSFTWPAAPHAGVIGFAFTVQPEHAGGSRCPNAAQVSLVEAHLAGEFPGDDGAQAALLANHAADVALEVDWAEGAAGWADLAPWPPYYPLAPSSGPGAVRCAGATSATSFTLGTVNSIYTGIRQPQVGQSIAFYDQANFTWRIKRIASFTGTGPWVITCDTANGASDTVYTPQIAQRVCPWSDSLKAILPGLWKVFDSLGPGEMTANPFDEGKRRRRQPAAPAAWPYKLTTKMLVDNIRPTEVSDIDVLEGDGLTPAIGTPGLLAYVLHLRRVYVFPKTTT